MQSEVCKALKEMRDNETAGDDDVRGNVLKFLGEDVLKMTTQLISNTHETGEWPTNIIEVKMLALEKCKATKCNDHPTYSTVARMFRRRIERKVQDVYGQD